MGVITITLFSVIPTNTDAVTIHPGVHLHIGNEQYNISSLTLSRIFLAETYLQANNTQFHITAPNQIYFVLNYLNGSMMGSSWDLLLNMTAFTNTDDNVYFNISGFTVDSNYTINRSGLSHRDSTANITGYINWTNNDWDTSHYFEVYIKETTIVINYMVEGIRKNTATILAYGAFILPIGLLIKKHKKKGE